MKRAIVIVDHGSRQARANAVVAEIAREIQARAGGRATVSHAHLEAAEPSLAETIDRCVSAGAREVTVQPLFLAPGKHAARDIPEMVEAARLRHPGVSFQLGDVIGVDPLLIELLLRRVALD
jgi:sirohydrochlorin ferrochelatase